MALFGIPRYTGGEEQEEKKTTSGADKILADLHRKAEEKRKQLKESPAVKRRRESSDEDAPSPDAKTAKSDIEGTPKSEKKKKKKKDKLAEEAESPSPVKSPKSATKSKKKQKKVEVVSDSEEEEITDTKDESSSDGSDSADDMKVDADDGQVDIEPDSIRHKLLEHANSIGGFTVLGELRRSKVKEVERVLPDWLAHPTIVEADIRNNKTPAEDVEGLAEEMKEKMQEAGITELFPVQVHLIKAILSSCSAGYLVGPGGQRPRDICCSAPTGSGKTLAYVLPLIQVLWPRTVRHVRVLVVLPVADLANQVYSVFAQHCEDTPLKLAKLTGHKTIAKEAKMLVKKGCRGYESLADIIVATPGRLVDHLKYTQGFTLEHLRFLVMDEADRMMEEYKQDWLHEVEKACPRLRQAHSVSVASMARMEMPVQKLLFSATLSQNPEKLQELKLFRPKLYTSVVNSAESNGVAEEGKASKVVTGEFVGKYTTPSGLTEYYIEADVNQKALMILYMMHHLKFRRVLCFTNSLESTHRLYLIMKLVGGDITVQEFSSSQSIHRRQRMLKQFSAGKLDLLICSDAMARGMDISGRVKYVVSYDAPRHLDTYVHRAGRTARAGHAGIALTLLEKKEIYHFKKMCKAAGKDKLKEMTIKKGLLKPYVESFQDALKQLPYILKGERQHHA